MEVKVLSAQDINNCLRLANAIGRGVHDEIGESIKGKHEQIIVKIMCAELMLLNVMQHYANVEPNTGLQTFNNIHQAIQQVLANSNIAGGNNAGNS